MDMPKILYKYIPTDSIKFFFERKTICFSPSNKFNDPFEIKAKFKNIPREDIMSLISKSERSIEHFKGKYLSQHILDKSIQEAFNKSANDYGILCLSSEENIILMWSHYAENHSGLVIGIDIEKLIYFLKSKLNIPEPKIKAVSYSKFPFEINSLIDITNIVSIYFNKYEAWSYEQEWRMIFPCRDIKNSDYKPIPINGVITIPENVIHSVTFGVKTTCKTINTIKKYIANNNFNHVKLKQAIMSDSEYALIIKNYED